MYACELCVAIMRGATMILEDIDETDDLDAIRPKLWLIYACLTTCMDVLSDWIEE